MKLNKFNKHLKEEFNETIEDKIVVSEAKKFHFKFRYALLGIAAIIIAFLVVDHISVQNYNSKITNYKIDYQNLNIATEKYNSKNEMSGALIYTDISKRTSALENIGSLFSLKGCTSSKIDYKTSSGAVDIPTDESNGGKNSYNTNVQESGIDEADVAKCDGNYIYSYVVPDLYIYDLEGNLICKEERVSLGYVELYIHNDKIILMSDYKVIVYTFNGTSLTRSFNKEIGGIIDSRLADNHLYYVVKEKLLLDNINYNNAYYDGCINPSRLYRIFKLNLNDLNDEKEANIVSNSNSIIYMSDNYFYLASTNYYNKSYTNIFVLDYDLNGYTAIKEVGYYLNKYSFSEYEGRLRYVLTDRTKPINNSIYVYNLENKKLEGSLLNQIGLVDELVKSVRFDGNICYVCTYRNTDPLYTIDLSNPEEIKIKSELHVPGYSGYLHNFDIDGKKYVLGIGYNESNYQKISFYEQDGNDLKQIGKDLVIVPNDKYVLFDEIAYITDGYVSMAMLYSYKGYMFYIEDDDIYFGTPVNDNIYTIFKIDLKEEQPISVYKEYKYNNNSDSNYLRCFLVDSKLYYVGDGNIHIDNF